MMLTVILAVYLRIYDKKPQSNQTRKQELYDNKYSIDMNRYAAQDEREASEFRTGLVEQLNLESDALSVKEQKAAEAEMAAVQRQTEILSEDTKQRELVNKQTALYNATEKGYLLDTYDFEQQEKIRFENEVKLMEQKVKWALIAKTLSSHQKVIMVQDLLDGLYRQIEDIDKESYSEETKKRMKDDREIVITRFKGYINAEGDRLLETGEPG